MKRINEIFYSLQGEGYNAGRAAVFVRFAGCNLRCPFCDTDFNSFHEMTDEDILSEMMSYPSRLAVLTGGEPTLQVDCAFVDMLHEHGFEVAIETNGTSVPPENIDWVTCSPKGGVVLTECNELKYVYNGVGEVCDYGIKADHYFIQPCDTGDDIKNKAIIAACTDYVKGHPVWRLSLQTHKLVGFK